MTTPPHPPGDQPPAAEPQPGGDPVCWLARVCPECGQFIEDTRIDPESHCPTSIE